MDCVFGAPEEGGLGAEYARVKTSYEQKDLHYDHLIVHSYRNRHLTVGR